MQTTNADKSRRWGRGLIALSALLMAIFIVRLALESWNMPLFTLSPAAEAALLVATVACFITACIRLE
ncbi:MAG: hypothetical protein U9Q35_12570 [Pseudomonadota bacterium]|mgnify:CR=1 FL=1|uniref:hypothetical protein n=1 Tax=Halomonas sp. IOP_31 TaxID=2876584 RepID=UPI001E3C2D15|nr:hypothetical protein [Halomonas sp. IOP_31]MCD6006822.1 hypothetical protein [Halomonas sp. IOP_31]MEA3252360.1 hypothetical protein [Pseudomonadota bacterium]